MAQHRWMPLLAAAALAGCTHLGLEDCPENGVLGRDVARLRTASFRIELADPGAAAARVLPLALMSALAYRDGDSCNPPGANPVSDDDAQDLLQRLRATPQGDRWERVPSLELAGGCEDDTGLAFHVWQRPGTPDEVVMALRGTSNFKDWPYGNLWWFSRFVLRDNQYSRTRGHLQRVLDHMRSAASRAGKPAPRVLVTGHSLGGGLAQHALYSFPDDVLQAVVFDASSVTGFVDVDEARRAAGCNCRPELGAEARMLRVYESYEVLSNLRIFHKLFFPPHLHIQELRFGLDHSWNPVQAHGMRAFAKGLDELAKTRRTAAPLKPWYSSRESACTGELERAQAAGCSRRARAPSAMCM